MGQEKTLYEYHIAGKFGGELNLAVWQYAVSTAKLKSTNFFPACMYVWRYRTIPPNLNPPIVSKALFGAKPSNLMTANISSYMVFALLFLPRR